MDEDIDPTVSLINRIRFHLSMSRSLNEIVARLTDDGVTTEFVFLAYHAALILESDYE